MIRLAISLLMLVASPALATQEAWPATYSVIDVSADDVLNVREGPDATSPIIGTLAHDATGVEVIRPNEAETWGLVNVGERAGWVSLRFLARDPGQWYGAPFPITACFGTEPFWNLATGETWRLSTPEGEALTAQAAPLRGSIMHRERHVALSRAADGRPVALVTVAQACNDGMSDRDYGIGASFLVGEGDAAQMFSGCCTLQHD